jgi:hypothetical protein
VYGIKTAVRRLEFAPDPKDMEVTDITSGRFVFRPRPGKPVSLIDLRKAITKAGYEIEGTRIAVSGALTADGKLRVPETGQMFRLEGEGEERIRTLREQAGANGLTVTGVWTVVDREEVIQLEEPAAKESHP